AQADSDGIGGQPARYRRSRAAHGAGIAGPQPGLAGGRDKMNRVVRALAVTVFAVLAIAATGNWNATVAQTEGGHVLGNPAAKTKLTEFVSYTCPHCAHFEQESEGAIRLGWVQSG